MFSNILSVVAILISCTALYLQYLGLSTEQKLQLQTLKELLKYKFGSKGYKRFVDFYRPARQKVEVAGTNILGSNTLLG